MDNVVFETTNNFGHCIGKIILNRPQSLNALDAPMCQAILQQLGEWAKQRKIKAVIIKSQGDKAFCAGGDIKFIYQLCQQQRYEEAKQFFLTEYAMNHAIFHFPKPYIAFLDGVTMGGGVGLSIHSSFSIATQRLSWAMPETKIGFFPDVGACYELARIPPPIARYLALTGVRINARDALELGIVTAIIDFAQLPQLEQDLTLIPFKNDRALEEIISRYLHSDLPHGSMLADLENIKDSFNYNSVEEIMSHLDNLSTEWSQKTLKTLQANSPLSLKITLEHLERSRQKTFDQVLHEDQILCQRFLKSHDFLEGVRALLIDKDNQPKWQSQEIAQVTDEMVSDFFKY